MRTIYFIINPEAKNGYCRKVWAAVEHELQEKEINYTAIFTERSGHATEIAASLAKEHEQESLIIVAVGGDGTLHEVVNGALSYRQVKIGFIPGGSGNDFIRGYNLPKDPLAALQVILQQANYEAACVDVGSVANARKIKRYFINNTGAGFDALVAAEAGRSPLKGLFNRFSLGSLIYAYFLIVKLFTYKSTDVIVELDGQTHHFEKTWFVTVSNQPFYGGGMKIAPNASPVDGLLNITVVHKLSKLKLLLVFITVFWGGHTSFKEVRSFTGKNISIQSQVPLHTHADGEYLGETPLTIQLHEQMLPILLKGELYKVGVQ